MLDDIRTEAHRLGELETAFLRQANEIADLRHDVLRLNHELAEMVTRVDTLEVLIAFSDEARPWYRRLLWFT